MNKKNFNQLLGLLAISALTGFFSCSSRDQTSIKSPDGRIEVTLKTSGGSTNDLLTYDVVFNDRLILEKSPLGFEFPDSLLLANPFSILGVEDTLISEDYMMPFGKSTRISSLSNQQTVFLANAQGHRLDLIFRVFNDGLGFRYFFPDQDIYDNSIGSELFREITVAWDETRVLHARVGDYISVARRKNSEWFIGSITDWTPRELEISLDFMANGDYIVEMYADAPDSNQDPRKADRSYFTIKNTDTLKIRLASGGGNVIRITPEEGKLMP
ncbi:MAG: glycoside hydrolase family 97 C-terminal domain-containing protein [Cyclobacteriaceae bacterium]|nr:glycoside hydrolase family 97 C-terminal domain-containing protein [Cyclobacteriaceae bacterium]